MTLGHAENQPSSKSLVVVSCVSPADAKCRIAVRVLMTRRSSLVPLGCIRYQSYSGIRSCGDFESQPWQETPTLFFSVSKQRRGLAGWTHSAQTATSI